MRRPRLPPADDMDAVPVKHFIKHVMELYKNNLQGFSEEFEVLPVPIIGKHLSWCMSAT